jgi:hypothetical protein
MSLERAGILPKVALTLVRHSEIRLLLQADTHIELHDQEAAIQALPRPRGETGERPAWETLLQSAETVAVQF